MNQIPKFLFRGDKFGNTTLPEKFYTDGLFSKLLQGGNPKYLSKNGIYNSIKAHIAPSHKDEFNFYKTTHFLSFTENKNIALFYASEKRPNEMIKTSKYKEWRYLFIFNLRTANTILTKISNGIYKFSYSCNRQLIEPISIDTPELIDLRNNNCNFCQNNIMHSLIVIDVVTILQNNQHYQNSEKALENAIRDKEWLILPFDYNADLLGYDSRIPRANFWSVELYKLKSENDKTIDESLQGIML